MHVTPQQVQHLSVRTFAVSLPVAVLILVAWVLDLLPHDRPFAVLMVYLFVLATAVVAGISACAAACHMAIGRAFAAGLRVGSDDGEGVPPTPGARALRLVE